MDLKEFPVPGTSHELAAAIEAAGASCLENEEVRKLLGLARTELVERRRRPERFGRLVTPGILLMSLALLLGFVFGSTGNLSRQLEAAMLILLMAGIVLVMAGAIGSDSLTDPTMKWEVGPLPDPPDDLRKFSSDLADLAGKLRSGVPSAVLQVYRIGKFRLLAVAGSPGHGIGFVAAWTMDSRQQQRTELSPAATQLAVTANSREGAQT